MRAVAWEVDGEGDVEARIPVQEARLRRLLIAALIAESRPFTIKWTPGYGPVEVRVRLSDAWPAFVSIDSARPEQARTRVITVASERRPALPVGLALVG
jgi:hypothetical protein